MVVVLPYPSSIRPNEQVFSSHVFPAGMYQNLFFRSVIGVRIVKIKHARCYPRVWLLFATKTEHWHYSCTYLLIEIEAGPRILNFEITAIFFFPPNFTVALLGIQTSRKCLKKQKKSRRAKRVLTPFLTPPWSNRQSRLHNISLLH